MPPEPAGETPALRCRLLGCAARARTALQITQPHLTTSPFNFSEPLAGRIKRRYHANPNQIDDRQTVAVVRRYRRWTGRGWICKKPFRMAINIDGAKQDEQRRQRRARTKKPFAALSRFADQPGTKAVPDRHHSNPWHQRITRSEAITLSRNDDPAAVQNLPEPAEFPECSR